MTIEKALYEYGLNKKEVALYLCLLKHVELSVFQLAQKTKLARTSVYGVLDGMEKNGLVTSLSKNNVKYYSPENPKRLLALLKEKESLILEALPGMMNIIDSAGKNPSVRLYLGEAGVKQVLEDVLQTIEEQKLPFIQAASQLDLLKAFPKFFPDWHKRRRGIKHTFTQLIVPEKARLAFPVFFGDTLNRETRFMPEKFIFKSSLEIYGSKTATISLQNGEYYSIVIDSPAVTEMFKQLFLVAWDSLGPA